MSALFFGDIGTTGRCLKPHPVVKSIYMEHEPSNYEFSDFVKEYKDRYDKVLLSGDVDQTIEVSDEWAKFMQMLKQKHDPKEMEKYALYQAMTGTPVKGAEIIADDMEGEDSISQFIEGLEKKYGTV
jgi:hypothetical protein